MMLQNQPRPLQICQKAANPNGATAEEIQESMYYCSGYIKMMMAAANNTALSTMYRCHDRIADIRSKESYRERPRCQHPMYRQHVKQLFMQAFRERDRYRQTLINPMPGNPRFFCVKDLTDEQQNIYGNTLTDTQYFEFWEGSGSMIYQKSEPFIGSLWNKYRLSMLRHNVICPELTAWGLVGETVLELAVAVWQNVMTAAYEECQKIIPLADIQKVFQPFSLERISAAWNKALVAMVPATNSCQLDEVEERNIGLGIEQLMELWLAPEVPYDSLIKACEDYEEDVFASKGQAKKAIRELINARNEATENK